MGLLLTCGLLSCKATTPGPLLDQPPARRVMWLEHLLNKGWIRLSVVLPATGIGPHPALITPIVPDEALLDRGVAVVRFQTNWNALAAAAPRSTPRPLVGPQVQIGRWLLAANRPGSVGRAYFTFLTTDAERSIPAVLDALEQIPQIDPERIAISGSSTSGFVAFQALVGEPRLAAGLIRVACADYETFLRESNLGYGGDERWVGGGRLPIDDDYRDFLARIEPLPRLERLAGRPLLLLTGEQDPAIPSPCVDATIDRLEPLYRATGGANRLRHHAYPDLGHSLGADAQRRALEFIDDWLDQAF